jgi:hypothetical protein
MLIYIISWNPAGGSGETWKRDTLRIEAYKT